MNKTLTKEQKAWDLQCYGVPRAMIDDAIDQTYGSKELLAVSMLSDAQEVMSHGDTELARQFINKAKYVILSDKRKKVD